MLTDEPARRKLVLHAPIAPGIVRPVGIGDWQTMDADQPLRVDAERRRAGARR